VFFIVLNRQGIDESINIPFRSQFKELLVAVPLQKLFDSSNAQLPTEVCSIFPFYKQLKDGKSIEKMVT
jgi:hypothetical protein